MGEKTIVVLNNGRATFKTTAGELKPGNSLELPEKEAQALLEYRGLVDASKIVKTPKMAELLDTITKLKAENEQLRAELASLKGSSEREHEHGSGKKKG